MTYEFFEGKLVTRISMHFPPFNCRTDNAIKNHYYSTLRRNVRKIHKAVTAELRATAASAKSAGSASSLGSGNGAHAAHAAGLDSASSDAGGFAPSSSSAAVADEEPTSASSVMDGNFHVDGASGGLAAVASSSASAASAAGGGGGGAAGGRKRGRSSAAANGKSAKHASARIDLGRIIHDLAEHDEGGAQFKRSYDVLRAQLGDDALVSLSSPRIASATNAAVAPMIDHLPRCVTSVLTKASGMGGSRRRRKARANSKTSLGSSGAAAAAASPASADEGVGGDDDDGGGEAGAGDIRQQPHHQHAGAASSSSPSSSSVHIDLKPSLLLPGAAPQHHDHHTRPRVNNNNGRPHQHLQHAAVAAGAGAASQEGRGGFESSPDGQQQHLASSLAPFYKLGSLAQMQADKQQQQQQNDPRYLVPPTPASNTSSSTPAGLLTKTAFELAGKAAAGSGDGGGHLFSFPPTTASVSAATASRSSAAAAGSSSSSGSAPSSDLAAHPTTKRAMEMLQRMTSASSVIGHYEQPAMPAAGASAGNRPPTLAQLGHFASANSLAGDGSSSFSRNNSSSQLPFMTTGPYQQPLPDDQRHHMLASFASMDGVVLGGAASHHRMSTAPLTTGLGDDDGFGPGSGLTMAGVLSLGNTPARTVLPAASAAAASAAGGPGGNNMRVMRPLLRGDISDDGMGMGSGSNIGMPLPMGMGMDSPTGGDEAASSSRGGAPGVGGGRLSLDMPTFAGRAVSSDFGLRSPSSSPPMPPPSLPSSSAAAAGLPPPSVANGSLLGERQQSFIFQ